MKVQVQVQVQVEVQVADWKTATHQAATTSAYGEGRRKKRICWASASLLSATRSFQDSGHIRCCQASADTTLSKRLVPYNIRYFTLPG